MPEIVSCPDCGRKLRVPDDLLGKKVKCPGCGQKFQAKTDGDALDEAPDVDRGAAFAPSPSSRRRDADDDVPKSRRRADEEDQDDYRRRRDDDDGGPRASKADIRQGWERVRFGVNLVIMSCWILVGTIVAAITGGLLWFLFVGLTTASLLNNVSANGPPPNQQQMQQQADQAAGTIMGMGCAMFIGAIVIWGLIGLLTLAWEATRITGYGFCMGVASTRKTQLLKGLAIAVFCLGLANLLMPTASCGAGYLMLRTQGGCILPLGGGVSGLLILAEFICFLLFLRGVAVNMKKDDLAQHLVIYTIAVPIFFLISMGLMILLPLLGGAALFGTTMSAASSNNPSAAAGNAAGMGVALLIGGITCTGVLALIGIALFVWFVVMLYQVRGAIDGWLDRN